VQVGLGRLYTVTFVGVSATAAQDLFYIKPAADKPCILEAVYLSNVGGTADAGDAQEELLRLEVIRLPATVTAGSVGTAPTPTPVNPNDTAAKLLGRTVAEPLTVADAMHIGALLTGGEAGQVDHGQVGRLVKQLAGAIARAGTGDAARGRAGRARQARAGTSERT
jgi:hypothetical protein